MTLMAATEPLLATRTPRAWSPISLVRRQPSQPKESEFIRFPTGSIAGLEIEICQSSLKLY